MALVVHGTPPGGAVEELSVAEEMAVSTLSLALIVANGAKDIFPFRVDPEECPPRPSEVASVYGMVQAALANPHRVHKAIARRPKGPWEYAWMSWLPARHGFPQGTVSHSSDSRITKPSIFHAAPPRKLAAAPPPGRRTAFRGASAFIDPRGLRSHSGLPQAARQPTAPSVVEMGSNGGHDSSDEARTESNGDDTRPRLESALAQQNNNVQGNLDETSMVDDNVFAAVQLLQLRRSCPIAASVCGTKYVGGAPITGATDGVMPSDPPAPGSAAMGMGSVPSNLDAAGGGGHGEAEKSCSDSEHDIGVGLPEQLAMEARRKAAFVASFDFTTQRCSPTAPCSSCLQFCEVPVPEALVASSKPGVVAVSGDDGDDRPPVLRNMSPEEEAARRRASRHGPRSKSSEYRGVTFYKRTGRWEAHIWHGCAQLYLGASVTLEEAARAYDKAAILLLGRNAVINFERESYRDEMRYLYRLNKEQLIIYLRRDSRGLGAQSSYPGVKHVRNRYHAIYDEADLGTFSTEEEAAKLVYKTALENSCGTLASMIINTHHVRKMQSYATQLYAALHPDQAEAVINQLNNRAKASKKRGAKSSPSTKRASAPKKARRPACPTDSAAAAAPRTPPASSSRRARNKKSSAGVSGMSPTSPSPAVTVLAASSGSAVGQAPPPTSVAGCSANSPSPMKKRPSDGNVTADTGSAQLAAECSSNEFKLFNVEINMAEEAST